MADDDIDDTDDIPEADDGDASEGEAVAKPVKPVARLGEIVASALRIHAAGMAYEGSG